MFSDVKGSILKGRLVVRCLYAGSEYLQGRVNASPVTVSHGETGETVEKAFTVIGLQIHRLPLVEGCAPGGNSFFRAASPVLRREQMN